MKKLTKITKDGKEVYPSMRAMKDEIQEKLDYIIGWIQKTDSKEAPEELVPEGPE